MTTIHINLAVFNASIAALGDVESKASFLDGFTAAVNGQSLEPRGGYFATGAAIGLASMSEPAKPKRTRRNKSQIFESYSEDVATVANWCANHWPSVDASDRRITINLAMLADNVCRALSNQTITTDKLISAATSYLTEAKSTGQWLKTPQHFFGPGHGTDTPAWVAYVNLNNHLESRTDRH